MERVKKAGGNLTNGYWGEQIGTETTLEPELKTVELVKMTNDQVSKTINIGQLREHETAESPWFVVDGEVYDGTGFLKDHPGGGQSIVSAAGLDSSDEFSAIHSEVARAMMPEYHIGTLDEAGKAALKLSAEEPQKSDPSPTFLNAKYWKKAVLHSKKTVSWDSRIFTFKLEHEEQSLGLPIGQHLFIRLRDPADREAIIRSYTPISAPSRQGYMDVLVKLYFRSGEFKGGQMSQAVDSIPIGHFAEFKGPLGKFEYLGSGQCAINNAIRHVQTIVMICAGSGITPIFQVLRAAMEDASDTTQCIVMDCNRSEEDILCRKELDRFGSDRSGRCRITHTLSEALDSWQGRRGRIDQDLVREQAGREQFCDGGALALICGPKAFEQSVHQSLLDVGYSEDEMLLF